MTANSYFILKNPLENASSLLSEPLVGQSAKLLFVRCSIAQAPWLHQRVHSVADESLS